MEKNTEKRRKENTQAGIAMRLKILTVGAAIIGALFFGVCGVSLVRNKLFAETYGISVMPVMMLLGITAIFCYAALWQFWKVCGAIGRDNSFSLENYVAFRIMCGLFVILGFIWMLSIAVYLIFTEKTDYMIIFKMCEYTFVWFGVGGLTGALAKLIDKARQIREENDLTI
ncbi:MAG: DUF2975 domain-containing protein [Lachnospiraceae bacterium]|nr:DUF2975 domain-containing protein [Lachnospiraceae bacterium]